MYVVMEVDYVVVLEDGSLNGRVLHSRCLPSSSTQRHRIRVSRSGRGHPKHENENSETFGHDACDIRSSSITVADGHGPRGDEAALYAIACARRLPRPSGTILALNGHGDIEKSIRQSMSEMIQSCPHSKSGSTMTHVMFVECGARRWAIITNVGDSEALIIYKNRVHVCSVPHNWDNFEVYKRYTRFCKNPMPVCYNRWNAGKHRMKDANGRYDPIMMYEKDRTGNVCVHDANADFMSKLHERKCRPDLRYGTQSKRIPAESHENWGSTVIVDGRALGQVMASVGDGSERDKTGVPYDMVHVYIHEIPVGERVVVVAHTDGVSNERTIDECGLVAWSVRDANEYLQSIESPKDDMACCIAQWTPIH